MAHRQYPMRVICAACHLASQRIRRAELAVDDHEIPRCGPLTFTQLRERPQLACHAPDANDKTALTITATVRYIRNNA